jgi:hypothetical protein
MKKLILVVGLTAVAIACGSAADMMGEIMDAGVPDAGADPGDGSTMKFVGASTGTATCTNGLFALYAACQETYGADHRMCTLAEIMNTANMPNLAEGTSWYAATLTSLPCTGYSQNRSGTTTLRAPTVNELVQLSGQAACGSEMPVACCGPK